MTFKVKLGAIGFVAVVVLTVLLVLLTVRPFCSVAEERVVASVKRSAELAPGSQRLYAYDLLATAKGFASRPKFAKGLKEAAGEPRRNAIYAAINELDKQLADKGRKPGFLGVVDAKGLIIARDLDPNADHGDKLNYAVVDRVLKTGRPSTAVWLMKNRMTRAAVAPVIVDGAVGGALVLAYDFTAAEARADSRRFGTQIAYVMGSAVRAASFHVTDEPKAEDASMVVAVGKALGGEVQKAMAANKVSGLLDVELQGRTFKAIVGPLPTAVTLDGVDHQAAAKKQTVGFIALASLSDAVAPVRRAMFLQVAFGVLFLLLVLGSMWFVAKHFVEAEDELELGVNEMINGNLDYTFEVMGEFEGLANGLNVVFARLLGRPEPGEDEEGEAWRADVIFIEELAVGADPEVAHRLAAEAEDQYYARVYQEYVEARKRAGLSVEGITYESLSGKLRANEAMLKAKHECQMVRFVVRAEGDKVSFEPVRIG